MYVTSRVQGRRGREWLGVELEDGGTGFVLASSLSETRFAAPDEDGTAPPPAGAGGQAPAGSAPPVRRWRTPSRRGARPGDPVTNVSNGPARRTGPALEAMYQLVKRLIPALDRFPRRRKLLFGDRIRSTAPAGLEKLVEATFTRNRPARLDGGGTTPPARQGPCARRAHRGRKGIALRRQAGRDGANSIPASRLAGHRRAHVGVETGLRLVRYGDVRAVPRRMRRRGVLPLAPRAILGSCVSSTPPVPSSRKSTTA